MKQPIDAVLNLFEFSFLIFPINRVLALIFSSL